MTSKTQANADYLRHNHRFDKTAGREIITLSNRQIMKLYGKELT